MRKIFTLLILLLLLPVTALAADITPAKPSTGDGTAESPYQIGTAEELYWFAQQVNGGSTGISAVLTNDITVNADVLDADGDLNGTPTYQWTPIGSSSNRYTGTFDGQDHTISGLYYDYDNSSSSDVYVGLFGYVYNGGTVKNVGVADSYLSTTTTTSNAFAGGVCGWNDSGGTITNCWNRGIVSATFTGTSNKAAYSGGVCGWNYGTITNCYNSGAVSATDTDTATDTRGFAYAGGVCAYNAGTIEGCWNSGSVTASTYYSARVGGVCGYNNDAITNCWNSGSVTASGSGSFAYAGGVCGQNYSSGTIEGCWNSGSVTATDDFSYAYSGGVCGYNYGSGTIENCYWLTGTATNGIGTASGSAEATEKNVADFASGAVTWLLNSQSTNGPWRQTLGEDGDDYPVLDATHGVVVPNGSGGYTNITYDDNGFFTVGSDTYYQPATLENGVYQISNAGQLYWFAGLVNGGSTGISAVLTNDITVNADVLDADGDLNGTPTYQWTPIGSSSNQYTGTFDGQGHTISGLYCSIEAETKVYAGLFGYVGSGGTVKKVGVADSYLSATGDGGYVGGVCGLNGGGIITNCWNSGSVTTTASGDGTFVGGMCGHNNGSGTIENCYNSGSVTTTASGSNAYSGGVCGYNYGSGKITNCYWLTGTATNGIGTASGSGEATKKNADEFASGAVTWLLNQGQENGPWRQTLGQDGDDYPVLNATHGVVYRVTVTVEDGGSTDYYYCNGSFTLPAAPEESKTGYTFSWSDGEETTYEAGEKVTITADTIFTGKWTANTYTVKFDANGGDGTMDNQTFTYDVAQALTANAFTRTGYTFAGWNTQADGIGDSYEDGAELSLTDNLTLYAQWTINTYTITAQVASGCEGMGEVTDGGTYEYGTTVTLTATPGSGYRFVKWEEDGETSATRMITVTGDDTYTALFEAEPYVPDPEPDPAPISYYNIYVENVCDGVEVSTSKQVVREGNSISVYVKKDTANYTFDNFKVYYKRSYYDTWNELKEGVQPGEYPINNIWTHIYIKAEGAEEKEDPTGIESIEGVKVYTKDGSLYVQTPQREQVIIVSMSGAVVKNEEQIGLKQYHGLQPGIYIVRVGDRAYKLRLH